jgi:hypothetical protein
VVLGGDAGGPDAGRVQLQRRPAGIRVMPTLAEAPDVTLSSDGDAAIVLTCPVPLPGD